MISVYGLYLGYFVKHRSEFINVKFDKIMNGKIGLSILIAFILVFSTLYGINVLNPTLTVAATVEVEEKPISPYTSNHPFFLQEFDPKIKKIFLLGSSQIHTLNSTLVIEIVQNEYKDHFVYNLAIPGDTASKRYKQLTLLISLEPVLVAYGLGYRDFHVDIEPFTMQEKILPDPKQVLGEINPIKNMDLDSVNPKLITTKVIDSILKTDKPIKQPWKQPRIPLPDTPLYPSTEKYFTIIRNDVEIKARGVDHLQPKEIHIDNNSESKQIMKIKEMIRKLQENEIKVIIFSTPHHKYYTADIPANEKVKLNSILEEISQDTGVKKYDFLNKYSDSQIWRDMLHVAYNKNSSIYSEDIAQMIISELNK